MRWGGFFTGFCCFCIGKENGWEWVIAFMSALFWEGQWQVFIVRCYVKCKRKVGVVLLKYTKQKRMLGSTCNLSYPCMVIGFSEI